MTDIIEIRNQVSIDSFRWSAERGVCCTEIQEFDGLTTYCQKCSSEVTLFPVALQYNTIHYYTINLYYHFREICHRTKIHLNDRIPPSSRKQRQAGRQTAPCHLRWPAGRQTVRVTATWHAHDKMGRNKSSQETAPALCIFPRLVEPAATKQQQSANRPTAKEPQVCVCVCVCVYVFFRHRTNNGDHETLGNDGRKG